MDRDALNDIKMSYEEVVSILSSQIGQLTTELIITKTMLQKLQDQLSLNVENDRKKSQEI